MEYAPIVIFTYRRKDALKVLVESLLRNPEAKFSHVYFFCDGAKGEQDAPDVEAVQRFVQSISGFASIEISISEKNRGLANSVIHGVSTVFEKNISAIVLEDDLEVSQNFLAFMNGALTRYENEKEVYSISGYSFNLKKQQQYADDAYFLNRAWSWTWATWKDRWAKVDWKVSDYLDFANDRDQRAAFSKLGSDVNAMLDKQMQGKIDSWAIRWVFQQFKVQGLTLYPVISKVYNHGFDEVATHNVGSNRRYITQLDSSAHSNFSLPHTISVNRNYQDQFNKLMSIPRRILSRIESLFVQLKRRWL
jgi:hypothetical protein